MSSNGSGLGRALARNAGTYLFDEPTAHLDTALRERLQAEISEQRRRSGAAAVYATHDTGEALALADRVVLIREGRVVQEGPPASVYDRPVDMWAARLTGPATQIDVVVVEATGDGRATIELGGSAHSVAIASIGGPATGPRSAIVRPDWVRLGGGLEGMVADVAYRGTHTDYAVATAAGQLGLRVMGPPSVGRGAVVGCTLDRVWIPADGTPEAG